MREVITGADLIAWGYTPGPWFRPALVAVNSGPNWSIEQAQAFLRGYAPEPISMLARRERGLDFSINLDIETADEALNAAVVIKHMRELMRVPTIKAGAVMPDACPAGSAPGTIPVGGIVACENAIHPGYHSADICCSMAITTMATIPCKPILDAAMLTTHFGPGGRADDERFQMSPYLTTRILSNPITAPLFEHARRHFGTQGDGNHFFSVGRTKWSDETAIVTHHGSRAFGARVYKVGQRIAEAHTKKIAAGIPNHQAWIVADTQEGQDYWDALQICREWTKENHFAIHNAVLRVAGVDDRTIRDRFWNEHNFVWQKSDGLFYHGKGATPAFPYFSHDTNGLTLIPMNMAEPILITRGLNAENGLGFAPHGAGRNMSRTAFKRTLPESDQHRAAGLPDWLDARWFSGTPDTSEMPGGYKNAESVRQQITKFGLAEIVDEVLPYGTIMAGEIDWRKAGKEMGESA